MYAVIKTGGHQYKVAEGEQLKIEKIEGNAGDTLKFSEVLLVNKGEDYVFGAPTVANVSVDAVIEEQTRNEKIIVFKYKRRKNYKRKRGHKQPQTIVKITKINN